MSRRDIGPFGVLLLGIALGFLLGGLDIACMLIAWLSTGMPELGFQNPLHALVNSARKLWVHRLLLGLSFGVLASLLSYFRGRGIRLRRFLIAASCLTFAIFFMLNMLDFVQGIAVDPYQRPDDMWIYSIVVVVLLLIVTPIFLMAAKQETNVG